jgi:hypothetical protein
MYFLNLKNFLDSLPHNSPIRAEVVQWVSTGVSTHQTALDFGFAERTVRAMKKKETCYLLYLNSVPSQKKNTIKEDQLKIAPMTLSLFKVEGIFEFANLHKPSYMSCTDYIAEIMTLMKRKSLAKPHLLNTFYIKKKFAGARIAPFALIVMNSK